jgi:hypothetical protein
MILSGRWAYKQYKKRRTKKEELHESAHAKHGELIVANQEEIFKTAVEDLGNATSTRAQQSDRPPSYSRKEQESLISPQPALHPSSSAESATSSPRRSPLEIDEPREAPLLSFPRSQQSPLTQSWPSSHTFPLSPSSSELAAGQPAEIQVHGKWVWVPDESPLPNTPGLPSIPHAIVDDSAVAELHAVGSLAELSSTPRTTRTSEEGHVGSFVLAELDGSQLPSSDLESEAHR